MAPVLERVPGDCYVWGSSEVTTSGKKSSAVRASGWLHSTTPTLVDNTTHLDVCEASHTLLCLLLMAYTYPAGQHHAFRCLQGMS